MSADCRPFCFDRNVLKNVDRDLCKIYMKQHGSINAVSQYIYSRISIQCGLILHHVLSWWRYHMEKKSALLALFEWIPLVTGGFHSQRPVTWSFDVFFYLRLNKRLGKQSRRQWFETPSLSLWRHYNNRSECNLKKYAQRWAMRFPVSVFWRTSTLLYRCGIVHGLLQWRHNGHDSVSNHQPHDCLLKRFFRCRSKKTPKLRVTGLFEGNSPGSGDFPVQMASNAENVSIWWRHHDFADCECRQMLMSSRVPDTVM